MKPGQRFGRSAAQKSDVWRRWKDGQTLNEIGRAFGKEHSSIRCLVARHGGIVPAVRRRSVAPNVAGSIPVSHPNEFTFHLHWYVPSESFL
jgi:hypothetical protein